MRFLEYLFFKYCQLGHKVGCKENATTSAVLLMSFVFALYLLDIVIILDCFCESNLLGRWAIGFYIVTFVCLLLIFDFTLVFFGKSSRILTKHNEEWTGKKNLGAILFPIIAIVLFLVGCILEYK